MYTPIIEVPNKSKITTLAPCATVLEACAERLKFLSEFTKTALTSTQSILHYNDKETATKNIVALKAKEVTKNNGAK